jgi:hypothetical protein
MALDATEDAATPEAFVFQQKRAPGKPLWDSGVRDALHQAAEAEGCDFPCLGSHSFRRETLHGGNRSVEARLEFQNPYADSFALRFLTPSLPILRLGFALN